MSNIYIYNRVDLYEKKVNKKADIYNYITSNSTNKNKIIYYYINIIYSILITTKDKK